MPILKQDKGKDWLTSQDCNWFGLHEVRLKTKLKLYETLVLSTALYTSETWRSMAKVIRHLNVFHMQFLQKILKIRWQQRFSNEEILNRTGSATLLDIIEKHYLHYTGHFMLKPECRWAKVTLKWALEDGRQLKCRQKKDMAIDSARQPHQLRIGVEWGIWFGTG